MPSRSFLFTCGGVLSISGLAWLYCQQEPSTSIPVVAPTPIPTTYLSAFPITIAKPHFLARYVQPWGSGENLDVEGLAVSANGRFVSTWSLCPDPTIVGSAVQYWNVITKRNITTVRQKSDVGDDHYRVYQTRNGLKGVSSQEGFVLQNMKTGKIVRRFNVPAHAPKYRLAWTFSPDGKTLWWADDQQRIFWQSIG